MATENKVLNTRIKLKRDTSANWESNNPTLLNGEIIIVDTAAGEVRFKIGDGSKTYTQLPFEDEGVRNLIADKSKITVETWTDSSGSTAQFLNELVINKVKDRQTYEEMVDAGKIDTNELYFIEEDDEVAVTPVLTTGEKIATITIGDDITDIYAPLDVNPDWDQNDSTAKNYINNRTHYIEKAFEDIVWDGDMSGREICPVNGNENNVFVKVSDQIIPLEKLYGCSVTNKSGMTVEVPDSYINEMSADVLYCSYGFAVVLSAPIEFNGVSFASAGTYFAVANKSPNTICLRAKETVNQLDEKFIPATIARTADILPKPETAEVGNLISVKEVDENGKVTATDVVDISAEAAMELAAEMGLIDPVADEDGSIYVDENDLIYTI